MRQLFHSEKIHYYFNLSLFHTFLLILWPKYASFHWLVSQISFFSLCNIILLYEFSGNGKSASSSGIEDAGVLGMEMMCISPNLWAASED